MIETKLPDGLTLPEVKGGMTEQKLPLRETGTVFSHIPSFADYLRETRDTAISTVTDPEHLGSVRTALDVMASCIMAELKAPVPELRWMLHEYVGEYRDGEVVEVTQPAKFDIDDYWRQVNG